MCTKSKRGHNPWGNNSLLGAVGRHVISSIQLLGWESWLRALRKWMEVVLFLSVFVMHHGFCKRGRSFLTLTLPLHPPCCTNCFSCSLWLLLLSYKMYPFLLILLPSHLRNIYFTCGSHTGIAKQRFQSQLGHIWFLPSPDTHSGEPTETLLPHSY